MLDLRLPRVLTAMAVGAALSLAGVTYQGLLRNPLADPYVSGHGQRRGARRGDRADRARPARAARLWPAPPVRVRRSPGCRGGRLPRLAPRLAQLAHVRAPDRLRRRLAPCRRPGHDDVPRRQQPAPDLLLPARLLRPGVVASAAGRPAADRHRLSPDPVARAGRSTPCCWASRRPPISVSMSVASG